MADCPEKSVLVTYLYGEDSGRERARLEAHFAACRDCSEELASLRSVQVALSAWTVPEIDRGFDRWRTVAQPASSAARETWKALVVLARPAAAARLEPRRRRDALPGGRGHGGGHRRVRGALR